MRDTAKYESTTQYIKTWAALGNTQKHVSVQPRWDLPAEHDTFDSYTYDMLINIGIIMKDSLNLGKILNISYPFSQITKIFIELIN